MTDSRHSDVAGDPGSRLTRRRLLQRTGVAVGGLTALGTIAACGDDGASDATSSSTTASATSEGTPKQGGRLRIAYVGAGDAEQMDPTLGYATIDNTRSNQLYDRLARPAPDLSLQLELAESIEPNADASEWTIRLRDGVTWHDGSPLTTDDVLYTLRRHADKKTGSPGYASLSKLDVNAASKVDARTLRIPMRVPDANVPYFFVDWWMPIVKNGTKDYAKPVGTGPFVFDTFEPGRGSLFKRNDAYWRDGPLVDELEIISIPDDVARLNALLSGQVDAVDTLPFTLATEQESKGEIVVLRGDGAPLFTPMAMNVTQKPFDDVRVRQAFRLLADRAALVQSAQLGFGEVGNDLYGKGMRFYHDELAQREADPEAARSLLKAAGAEGLSVTMPTSTVAPGMRESATVFAEQAKAAGVNVTLKEFPAESYWTDGYLKTSVFQTVWQATPIPVWTSQALIGGSAFNETGWDDPSFAKLVDEASATLDEAKATELWWQAQEQLWNDGGYLIWGFWPPLDGLATSVKGAQPSRFWNLQNGDFRDWWLAS
jgi:peptide/nickel transport system substrate-binding protein